MYCISIEISKDEILIRRWRSQVTLVHFRFLILGRAYEMKEGLGQMLRHYCGRERIVVAGGCLGLISGGRKGLGLHSDDESRPFIPP